jgi:hypothetical protein
MQEKFFRNYLGLLFWVDESAAGVAGEPGASVPRPSAVTLYRMISRSPVPNIQWPNVI